MFFCAHGSLLIIYGISYRFNVYRITGIKRCILRNKPMATQIILNTRGRRCSAGISHVFFPPSLLPSRHLAGIYMHEQLANAFRTSCQILPNGSFHQWDFTMKNWGTYIYLFENLLYIWWIYWDIYNKMGSSKYNEIHNHRKPQGESPKCRMVLIRVPPDGL